LSEGVSVHLLSTPTASQKEEQKKGENYNGQSSDNAADMRFLVVEGVREGVESGDVDEPDPEDGAFWTR